MFLRFGSTVQIRRSTAQTGKTLSWLAQAVWQRSELASSAPIHTRSFASVVDHAVCMYCCLR
ncbi:hypothetical protein C8Q76DRAFT_737163 [Earliella scabrosa]|nr:hypothetical protein C8Q76DRAFT_737163 [Earliella scabrosa]